MTQAITDSYFNYLQTSFYLQDDGLRAQFDTLLHKLGHFTKGPILEATPPFVPGASIDQLINDNVLTSEFRQLRSPRLPLDRKLYLHQDEAVRKIVSGGRNLVVTTGTGSGKTEAFLIPIFDHLLRQAGHGRLQPGVQALLLYPMNALANDQMGRLRELLANYPAITFGRYTGETKESTREANALYERMFKCKPLPNELVSREQMRATPPNILLTNYAMLEYLLLRPADNVFFDGPLAASWRFLVIDEAHTYAGAKGIEMAVLLRRLKDRVVGDQGGKLHCIATSATLGKGEASIPAAADFAVRLFDEPFEWDSKDPDRQDVVRASRQPLRLHQAGEWSPVPALYGQWQKLIAANGAESDPHAHTHNEPLVEVLYASALALHPHEKWLPSSREIAGSDWRRFLYETLRHSTHLYQIHRRLQQQPEYVEELTRTVFGDPQLYLGALVALVDLAVKARPSADDNALLPARYHFFVRAIEGAYLQLRPQPTLFLERYEQIEKDGSTYAVFELATCRRCGAGYLAGECRQDSGNIGQEYLRHPSNRVYEEDRRLEYFLLLDNQAVVEEDENEIENETDENGTGVEDAARHAKNVKSKNANEEAEYWLCGQCGCLTHRQSTAPPCGCDSAHRVLVQRVRSSEGKVKKCVACGGRSPAGVVWRFLTGNDATASVLATAQFQHLPAKARSLSPLPTAAAMSSYEDNGDDDDDWGQPAPSSAEDDPRRHGRQLLVFSDSRQAAAFFAPYLNRTYSQIVRRRLILQTLEENYADVLANQWRIQDLIPPLLTLARRYGLVGDEMSKKEQHDELGAL